MTVLSDADAREALDRIWEVMQLPFDWSADTLDAIADVMGRAGYKQVDHDTMFAFEQRDLTWWAAAEDRYPRVCAEIRRRHTPRRPAA